MFLISDDFLGKAKQVGSICLQIFLGLLSVKQMLNYKGNKI